MVAPPSASEQPGEITWGEVFAVLPFGNRTVILTLTGAQLEQAFVNGFSPACNPAISTGRFPQISGLTVTYTCNGTTPSSTGMWKAPVAWRARHPIGPTDTVRLVTNDFMFTGGDGYTVLAQGTDVACSPATACWSRRRLHPGQLAGEPTHPDHHLQRTQAAAPFAYPP